MPNTAEVHLKERVIQRVSHISIELLSSVCYRKIQTSGKHGKRQKQSTDKGPCAQLTTPRASREPAWLMPAGQGLRAGSSIPAHAHRAPRRGSGMLQVQPRRPLEVTMGADEQTAEGAEPPHPQPSPASLGLPVPPCSQAALAAGLGRGSPALLPGPGVRVLPATWCVSTYAAQPR